ncbi:hypothetical protein EKO23_19670 [Nocardioides guangzhouensis]|uniref:Uncharacterized protein n=1 Tax=Nocardioides guangzhouensis TaxID=2497878 RepID=A0A4Q4Z6E0_9ACTN|nr:hypothetical protein [Nocardioides guangzhouensis]RYP83282.1 hypothetical protein EKO23_19670 [Nocardioides guangzhouensis]
MHALLSKGPARRSAARAAARRQRARGGAVVVGDAGARATEVLDLQRLAGNRAVTQLVRTFDGNGHSGSITLHGQAEPFFDGGTAKVLNPGVARKKGCDCPQDEPCMTGTGTLRVTYKVEVTITMPDVPGGLSACQERRVRDFLRNVLGPHEQEHARRLRTYDGTTSRPFSVTACGRPALDEAVNARIHKMQNDEHDQRSADAEKKSAAIDPFDRPVDLSCT